MKSQLIDKYYKILELSNKASIEDIKKAYKRKAELLHPDVNKSEHAHLEFFLLIEAYEFLVQLKNREESNNSKDNSIDSIDDNIKWSQTAKEYAKNKADQYVNLKFEDYTNSDHFKSLTVLNTLFAHLNFYFSVLIVLVLPLIAVYFYGYWGLGGALLIGIMTSPVTVPAFKKSKQLNHFEFFQSVILIAKNRVFLIIIITFFNVFSILKFGLQTLILPKVLLSGFILSFLLFYFVFNSKTNSFKTYFYTFCVAPLVVNFILLFNFYLSFNPVVENYTFKNAQESMYNGKQNSTYIYLENNAYEKFPGIRTFIDYNEMEYKNQVSYTFKTGVLGIRVMTKHEFK